MYTYTKREIRDEIEKNSSPGKAFESLLQDDCWPPDNWDNAVSNLPEKWQKPADEEGMDNEISIDFGYDDGPVYVSGNWRNRTMADAGKEIFQTVREEIIDRYSEQIYALSWFQDFISVLKDYEKAQAMEISVANARDYVNSHYSRLEPGMYPEFIHDGDCDKCGKSGNVGRNPYCEDENMCESCYSADAEYIQWAEWFVDQVELTDAE